MNAPAIVWFRRDLRLADNPALDFACSHHQCVVPVFIRDPDADGPWQPGSAGRWWLHHSLNALAGQLRRRGSRLILAVGDTALELQRFREATGAVAVYWNRLYEPAAVEQERKIERVLTGAGVATRSFNASLLFEPGELVKTDGSPYRVFTPYWKQMQRRWRPLSAIAEPERIPGPGAWPAGLDLERLGLLDADGPGQCLEQCWNPGEQGGRECLDTFAGAAVQHYNEARDRPDRPGTSRLSPHLHFGEVSPGQVMRALDESGELPAGPGPWAFFGELAWREYSHHLLWHFPDMPEVPLKAQFAAFPWRGPDDYAEDLDAWREGRTGYPMVDAGMRQLQAKGWMHNRVRMIAASFLTKNLLIPWQEGARWFWRMLVDADLANNSQGWQWTAGCGVDAAPYFRIFNPVLQGRKFDPQGRYIRHWCPETAGRATSRIHQPLEPGEAGRFDYPLPRVDLPESRRRALEAFERIGKGRRGATR